MNEHLESRPETYDFREEKVQFVTRDTSMRLNKVAATLPGRNIEATLILLPMYPRRGKRMTYGMSRQSLLAEKKIQQ